MVIWEGLAHPNYPAKALWGGVIVIRIILIWETLIKWITIVITNN